jgi:hypothetical protein
MIASSSVDSTVDFGFVGPVGRSARELRFLHLLRVERLAGFGHRNAPARYALTMYANDENGDPPRRMSRLSLGLTPRPSVLLMRELTAADRASAK